MLTFELKSGYAESLKLVIPAFAPVRFANFLYLPMARMRAENNQYQPSLYYSFSESSPLSYLVALSKKVIQMTNTIINTTESTLQSLYRYYSEMAKTWYKGDYTIDQETIYGDVFNALENALIRLPMQCPEDRKIKLALLQDIIKSPLWDNNNQIHPENDPGAMLALALCEQLAAE